MANNIIRRTWKQGGLVNIEDLRGFTFQAEEGGHTFLISGEDENGEPLALSGTPAGVLLRADGQDVALTCSVSDGVVSATLPAGAYVVPGRVGITIFLTSGGQKTAIYAAIGSVATTSSGVVAPPAGASVVDLVNAIEAAIALIPASYTDIMAADAPTYSASAVYPEGSYAWYDGKLYRCISPITSGETWTSAHWTLAAVGSDVAALRGGIGEFEKVTASSNSTTSRNVYCEKSGTYAAGDVIYIEPLSCSAGTLEYIYVYGFAGESYTKEYQWDAPTVPCRGVYITLTGAYDKIRVAFRLESAPGEITTASAIIAQVNGTTVAGRLLRDVRNYGGLKINCLGDSLTYGYVPSGSGTSPMSPGWVSKLAADFGCTVRNYGITNNALSNNPGGSGDPMCIRYTGMDNDADVVIVMGGTNDFLRVYHDPNQQDVKGAPMGTIDSADNKTFYGAYNALVQGLIGKYAARKTRIILMVPPMRNRSTEQNGQGKKLADYQQAVRDIAHKYALPYVDWAYDAGLSAYLISQDTDHVYTYDGIHITQKIVLGWILPMIEAKIKEVV